MVKGRAQLPETHVDKVASNHFHIIVLGHFKGIAVEFDVRR